MKRKVLSYYRKHSPADKPDVDVKKSHVRGLRRSANVLVLFNGSNDEPMIGYYCHDEHCWRMLDNERDVFTNDDFINSWWNIYIPNGEIK